MHFPEESQSIIKEKMRNLIFAKLKLNRFKKESDIFCQWQLLPCSLKATNTKNYGNKNYN
jgi:hypothetical protein